MIILIDRLTQALRDGYLTLPDSLIEDLKQTILKLEIKRIVDSDVDPFEIIAQDIMFGRCSLYDKTPAELLNELWDELERQGYECYRSEDGGLDCAEFDDYITDFLAKHLTAIELTKLLTSINDTNRNKS